MPRRARHAKTLPDIQWEAHIESLTQDARGVAHVDGKATFIQGGLPGEDVLFRYRALHKNYDEGIVEQIITASPARVAPRCDHFGVCGGCSLQHMAPEAQLAAKQQVLLEALQHLGKVQPDETLPPLNGAQWGYRRKARLGVKYVLKKERVLVGFREKSSGFLADLTHCHVLHPVIGALLPELRSLIAGLSAFQHIPQIEVAVADTAAALVFRHLVELSATDREQLRTFGQTHQIQMYLQAAGPDSITLLEPDTASLSYRLPNHDVELCFAPTDFTQVNADINRQMVDHAIALLSLEAQDRVLDLFCGLGNFTLPLARRAAQVVGVEGDGKLVQRARDNATRNAIGNVEFHAVDLTGNLADAAWAKQTFDKILLDPPRTGALDIIKQLPSFGASHIVYVSCNPATLARDAQELVHAQGYRLSRAGVMDMFPHTTHVESIALFIKENR